MAQFKCQFHELDQQTRTYLTAVRRAAGRRTPGIYIGGTNAWPIAAILGGPFVILVGCVFAFGSNKNPGAVALLLTATLLLGGWMIAYAFRRWLGGDRIAGFFTYFDTTHAYQATGDDVVVTDIADFEGVKVKHSYNDRAYAGSRVVFDYGDGKRESVPVANEAKADLVEAYYGSVVWIEEQKDEKWKNLSAAEFGALAKFAAVTDELPKDAHELELDVRETPDQPLPSNKGGFGLLPYLVLAAAGVACYFASWAILGPSRDHAAFADAKANGVRGLRDYLLDDRNTRHREEAATSLKGLYDVVIAKVEGSTTNKEYRDGLGGILRSLSEVPGLPVVSIRVTENNAPGEMLPLKEQRIKQIQTGLADALGVYIGPDFIVFVEAPAEAPPHLELVCDYAPVAGLDRMQTVTWQLRMRTNPADTATGGPRRKLPNPLDVLNPYQIESVMKDAVFQDLFGINAPFVPQAPIGGGDFD